MLPVKTSRTTGTYKAPAGKEDEIGDLPFYRENGVVYSEWVLDTNEYEAFLNNPNRCVIRLGIYYEPIPPVSLEVLIDGKN